MNDGEKGTWLPARWSPSMLNWRGSEAAPAGQANLGSGTFRPTLDLGGALEREHAQLRSFSALC